MSPGLIGQAQALRAGGRQRQEGATSTSIRGHGCSSAWRCSSAASSPTLAEAHDTGLSELANALRADARDARGITIHCGHADNEAVESETNRRIARPSLTVRDRVLVACAVLCLTVLAAVLAYRVEEDAGKASVWVSIGGLLAVGCGLFVGHLAATSRRVTKPAWYAGPMAVLVGAVAARTNGAAQTVLAGVLCGFLTYFLFLLVSRLSRIARR